MNSFSKIDCLILGIVTKALAYFTQCDFSSRSINIDSLGS